MSNSLNNIYYSNFNAYIYLDNPNAEGSNVFTTYNDVDLIVCSSLHQIVLLDFSGSELAYFPISNTNVYFGQPYVEQSQTVFGYLSASLQYNYSQPFLGSGLFKIDNYGFVGDSASNAEINVSSNFYNNSTIQTVYFFNYATSNLQSQIPFTVFQTISSSEDNVISSIFGSTLTYYYDSGSNVTESIQNLNTTLNRAFSGSFASSSYNLLYSTSSNGKLTVSASNLGSYANAYSFLLFTIPTGSIINTPNIQPNYILSKSLSGGTDIRSLSASTNLLSVSQSSNGYTTISPINDYYYIYLSGSGKYYESTLSVTDVVTGLLQFYSSSFNSGIIDTTITSSYSTNYRIDASVNSYPWIKLGYQSSSYIPVSGSDSGSIDAWNKYLYVSASILDLVGNDVYVIGGDIDSITEYYMSESVISDFQASGLINLVSCSIIASQSVSCSLLNFPIIYQTSSLEYLKLNYHNQLTSSIIDLSNTTTVKYLDCSNNMLSGSIPSFSFNSNIIDYDCSYNDLSGSINDITSTRTLNKFDCSNNHLTGHIPVFAYSISPLQYFDCSNNKLTGYVYDSFVSKSILSDSILYFTCSNNLLTGSINLDKSSLISFLGDSNQFSGSIIDLSKAISMQDFVVSNNSLSGSIPYLGNCISLTTFEVNNNKLSGYVSGSVPNTLIYFDGADNQFSQSAIDGIVDDLYNAGALNGYLDLRGSNNATASIFSSLKAITMEVDRGWEIYLPGDGTTLSTLYSNNLGQYPILPGLSDGLTSSYFYVTNNTISTNYIYYSGSQLPISYQSSFRVPTGHSFEVGLSGWYYVSSSTTLNYTSSLIIDAVSASVVTPIYSAIGTSAPLSWSFTGSDSTTYTITASVEYSGSYYDILLKYAEAVGY